MREPFSVFVAQSVRGIGEVLFFMYDAVVKTQLWFDFLRIILVVLFCFRA
jgi:hypothetical protein